MKKSKANRRTFLKQSVTSAAGLLTLSAISNKANAEKTTRPIPTRRTTTMQKAPRIRFSVIGINHDHIHGQIGATIRGGGEFVSFYAREPELAAAFAKRYPQAKQARSQNEI